MCNRNFSFLHASAGTKACSERGYIRERERERESEEERGKLEERGDRGAREEIRAYREQRSQTISRNGEIAATAACLTRSAAFCGCIRGESLEAEPRSPARRRYNTTLKSTLLEARALLADTSRGVYGSKKLDLPEWKLLLVIGNEVCGN